MFYLAPDISRAGRSPHRAPVPEEEVLLDGPANPCPPRDGRWVPEGRDREPDPRGHRGDDPFGPADDHEVAPGPRAPGLGRPGASPGPGLSPPPVRVPPPTRRAAGGGPDPRASRVGDRRGRGPRLRPCPPAGRGHPRARLPPGGPDDGRVPRPGGPGRPRAPPTRGREGRTPRLGGESPPRGPALRPRGGAGRDRRLVCVLVPRSARHGPSRDRQERRRRGMDPGAAASRPRVRLPGPAVLHAGRVPRGARGLPGGSRPPQPRRVPVPGGGRGPGPRGPPPVPGPRAPPVPGRRRGRGAASPGPPALPGPPSRRSPPRAPREARRRLARGPRVARLVVPR